MPPSSSKLKKIRDIERLLRRINAPQAKSDGPINAKGWNLIESDNLDFTRLHTFIPELKLSREETRNANKLQGKLEELEELKSVRLSNLVIKYMDYVHNLVWRVI